MAETESKKVLTIDTGSSASSVKELKDRLKELRDVLVATEKGTEAYNKAMQEAADIQHTLRDTTAELNSNAMDFGQVMNNSVNAVKGMVGAMQSAQAVMTLFGVESEDTAKAIQKMQASMALIQGMTAFESGIKSINRLLPKLLAGTKAQTIAQKALNAAMQPKVFLPIIAAVSALTLAFSACAKAEKERQKAAEEHAKMINEKELTAIKDYNSELEKNLSLQRRVKGILGESDVSIIKSEIAAYQKVIDDLKEQVRQSKEGLDLDVWMERYGSQYEDFNSALEAFNNTLSDSSNIRHAQERIDEYRNKVEELNDELKVAKALQDAKNKADKEAYDKEVAIANTEAYRIILQVSNAIKDPIKPFDIEEIDEEEEKVMELFKKYTEMLNVLKDSQTQEVETHQQAMSLLDQMYENGYLSYETYMERKKQIDEEYTSFLTTKTQQQINLYAQMANNVGAALTSIGNLYAEVNSKNGEVSKEVLERQKAMQIAGTIVSTLGGIAQMTNSVWSSPDTGEFWSKLALQIAMTTEMLANMGVSIAQIKNTSIGSTGASYSVSSGAMSSLNAPTVYTQDVQGSMINSNIRDSRVYVVESDITNTQQRVAVTESENRY